MDGMQFEGWVRKVDKKFVSEKKSCYSDRQLPYPSIKLFFLSLKTISQTQPMNQGLICILKAQYRKNV